MPLKNTSQANLVKTMLLVILTALSFSANAGHHGDAEHKAKKMMDKKHATDKSAIKSAVADKDNKKAIKAKTEIKQQAEAEEAEIESEGSPGADNSDG
ncbi:MAG: hypothetical protein KJP04_07795 [Arenicella sp.]|nr:hypothetical protein [Arenicella sp.]